MQTSDVSAPADSSWKTYAKADGIYARSSNAVVGPFGTATQFTAAGSNSKDVSGRSYAGASTTLLSPFDHEHLGVSAITSSSSNTLARPVVNIRAGANIGLAASDTNGDGVFDTITIVGSGSGSGSSAGALLGVTDYRPGSDTNIGSTSSATIADVDATNAKVVFTAPSSGNVLVRITCTVEVGAGLARMGLRESTTTLAESIVANSTDTDSARSLAFLITGISGGSHTYKAAFRMSANTFTIIGGPTFGSLVMEVWAAP